MATVPLDGLVQGRDYRITLRDGRDIVGEFFCLQSPKELEKLDRSTWSGERSMVATFWLGKQRVGFPAAELAAIDDELDLRHSS